MADYMSLHCNHCGKDVFKELGDYFMLKDDVWEQVCDNGFASKDMVLCKRCTEYWLGRKLTIDDYNDAPVNEFIIKKLKGEIDDNSAL